MPSKRSWLKAIYIHFALLLFTILPFSFLLNSVGENDSKVRVIAISQSQLSNALLSNSTSKDANIKTIPVSKKKLQNIPSIESSKNSDNKNISEEKSLKSIDPSSDYSLAVKPDFMKKKNIKDSIDDIINDALVKEEPALPVDKSEKDIPISDELMLIGDKDDVNEEILAQLKNDLKNDLNSGQSSVENVNKKDSEDILKNKSNLSAIFGVNNEDVESMEFYLSIHDVVRLQIEKCWEKYKDERDLAKDISVTMNVNFDLQGNVIGLLADSKNFITNESNMIFNQMNKNAKQALYECTPLNGLPIERYEEWRNVKINFYNTSNNE